MKVKAFLTVHPYFNSQDGWYISEYYPYHNTKDVKIYTVEIDVPEYHLTLKDVTVRPVELNDIPLEPQTEEPTS